VIRGFTLVEMIVVLAILGITAAAVVPAFARAVHEDELTRATGQLERALVAARGRAIERAVSVTVTLVPETGRYWVRLAEGEALDSGTVALDRGVRLVSAAPRPRFRFDPPGMADSDSLLVLGPTGARAVCVDRWTGEIHAEPR
jgi:type II secretion system protein H